MKVRILNGATGVAETVPWKEDKDAALEKKSVLTVEFCLGEDVVDAGGNTVFEQRQRVQRMRFPTGTTPAAIAVAVKTRGLELEAMIPTPVTPIEIDLT